VPYYVCQICLRLGKNYREYEFKGKDDRNRRCHLWNEHGLSGMVNARKFFRKVKDPTLLQIVTRIKANFPEQSGI